MDDAVNLAKSKSVSQFPIEVFPLRVQQIISATTENLGFPIDFIGASMLFAASVAIGNTYKVEVKKGFQEAAVLYLAIVGPPGSNKTHPLHFALAPIMETDKRSFNNYEQEQKNYERIMNLSKAERETEGLEYPAKPNWQKILLSDYTPEALSVIHKFNKRGLGVYVDELAGWFKNFNRYNKGSEMELWLSNWNSKPWTIDRKMGEPIHIPRPYISVAGTLQNALLTALAKEGRTENGFTDRILFAFPDDLKKPYWTEKEIDQSIIDTWQNIIGILMSMPLELDDDLTAKPKILRFDNDAKQLLFAWQRKNTDECNDESGTIGGIYSKMDMYAVRLALILQMIDSACNKYEAESVTVKAVKGSLLLVDYFKKTAVKVHQIISNTNPIDKQTADKRRLYSALPDSFTTEEGLRIAKEEGMIERTFYRFLNRKELFDKQRGAVYKKTN